MKTNKVILLMARLCLPCVLFSSCELILGLAGAAVGGEAGRDVGLLVGSVLDEVATDTYPSPYRNQPIQNTKKPIQNTKVLAEQKRMERKLETAARKLSYPYLYLERKSAYYAFSRGDSDTLVCYRRFTLKDIVKKTVFYDSSNVETDKRTITHGEVDSVSIIRDTLCLNVPPLMEVGCYQSGFSLKIPSQLSVGEPIKSSTLVLLTENGESVITFSGFQVVAKESLQTDTGVYSCYKVEGKMNGNANGNVPFEDVTYTLWITPYYGLVKAHTDYDNMTLVLKSYSYW